MSKEPYTLWLQCQKNHILYDCSVTRTLYFMIAVSQEPYTLWLQCHNNFIPYDCSVTRTLYFMTAVSHEPYTLWVYDCSVTRTLVKFFENPGNRLSHLMNAVSQEPYWQVTCKSQQPNDTLYVRNITRMFSPLCCFSTLSLCKTKKIQCSLQSHSFPHW